MPVEAADIPATSETVTPEAVTSGIPTVPLITFGAGGKRYRNQHRSGQCLDKKSPINAYDRSFQSDCNESDKLGMI